MVNECDHWSNLPAVRSSNVPTAAVKKNINGTRTVHGVLLLQLFNARKDRYNSNSANAPTII